MSKMFHGSADFDVLLHSVNWQVVGKTGIKWQFVHFRQGW
jgi:hypothetical protein